jgi:hypothetical protein
MVALDCDCLEFLIFNHEISVLGDLIAAALDSFVEISLGGFDLTDSKIKVRKVVYYVRRGGEPSRDELIAVNDLGRDIESSFTGKWGVEATLLQI